MKIVKLWISSIIDIDGNGTKTATLKGYAKYCLKYYATSLAAKGVILVARCFILIAKNLHRTLTCSFTLDHFVLLEK